jgi:hypothetical protein
MRHGVLHAVRWYVSYAMCRDAPGDSHATHRDAPQFSISFSNLCKTHGRHGNIKPSTNQWKGKKKKCEKKLRKSESEKVKIRK